MIDNFSSETEFPIKLHLPMGQVRNRIQQPDSKIHWPQTIWHAFLCMQQHWLAFGVKHVSDTVRGLYQRLARHQKLANAAACKEMHVK